LTWAIVNLGIAEDFHSSVHVVSEFAQPLLVCPSEHWVSGKELGVKVWVVVQRDGASGHCRGSFKRCAHALPPCSIIHHFLVASRLKSSCQLSVDAAAPRLKGRGQDAI
jgi:hypothetical protein